MRKFSITLLFLLQLHALIAQNKPEAVILTDLLKIKTVGNITLTKDGKRAAFTVNAIENDENSKLDYKYRTQIFTTTMLGNAAPKQLTTHLDGATKPAWSPDGKQIAFTRSVADKSQQPKMVTRWQKNSFFIQYSFTRFNPRFYFKQRKSHTNMENGKARL